MKVITAGRCEEGNDVVFNDPMVSRHHFQIIQNDDGHYRLSDLGSSNGTYINGRKVSGEVDLGENDIVRVGNTVVPWKEYFSGEMEFTTRDVPKEVPKEVPGDVFEEVRQNAPSSVQTEVEEPQGMSEGLRWGLVIAGIIVGLILIVAVVSRL